LKGERAENVTCGKKSEDKEGKKRRRTKSWQKIQETQEKEKKTGSHLGLERSKKWSSREKRGDSQGEEQVPTC